MSQDYVDDVYDSTFVVQTTMANVEKNFAALKSAFSGAAQPSNMVAGMWWYDTTANILKLRNEANTAWQSVWDFANNKPFITNLSNEITEAMIAASAKDPVAGTAGLRTLGTGAQQACAGNDARFGTIKDKYITQAKYSSIFADVAIGTDIYAANDAEKSVYSYPWTKMKEIKVRANGAMRASFEYKQGNTVGGHIGNIELRKNEVLQGASININYATTYQTATRDITCAANDLIQIYGRWTNSAQTVYCRNFRLLVDTIISRDPVNTLV